MSLFGNYLGTKAKDLHDGLVKAVVAFDPEGASAAQIEEYKGQVDQLAAIAAKAAQQAQADEARVQQLSADFDRHKKAAGLLAGQIDSAEGAAREQALEKILDEAERLKTDLATAQTSLADSQGYYGERKEVHARAAEKLLRAKSVLEAAVRDQERARQEAERAAERKRDVQQSAGLTNGLDTMDVALDAFKANASAARQKAEADKLTANALGGARESDSLVKAALAEADGQAAKPNLKDRLAGL